MKSSSLCCIGVATLLLASGCSQTVSTNEGSFKNPQSDGTSPVARQRESAALISAQNQQLAGFNVEVETAVADQSLIAWRKAIKGDEKGSLAMLDDLDRKYPDILTLKFMRGQVLEHFGRKKEAVKYYQQAVTGNEFSSLKLFKLAEIKRTTGDAKGSIADYKLLIQRAPNFAPAKLGLAQSLLSLDKKSSEAKTLIGEVLAEEPENKEAKALQLSFKNK